MGSTVFHPLVNVTQLAHALQWQLEAPAPRLEVAPPAVTLLGLHH